MSHERGDAVRARSAAQLLQAMRVVGRHHDEPRPVQQGSPDLEGGGVEGDRRELEEDLVAARSGVVRALHEADDAAVRDGHALRPPGRARGVHHVGEVCPPAPGEVEVVRRLTREGPRVRIEHGRGVGRRGERAAQVLVEVRHEPRAGVLAA